MQGPLGINNHRWFPSVVVILAVLSVVVLAVAVVGGMVALATAVPLPSVALVTALPLPLVVEALQPYMGVLSGTMVMYRSSVTVGLGSCCLNYDDVV